MFQLYSLNEEERKFTDNICNIANWIFFSMLILGYVEDPKSAKSFSMNQLKKLYVYVEVSIIFVSPVKMYIYANFLSHDFTTDPSYGR